MNNKKFYNMKIYSKPKINYNGCTWFNFKHYNKIPKINNNDLDDNDLDGYYAILSGPFNTYELIHITRSTLESSCHAIRFQSKLVKWKKSNTRISIDFRAKYFYRLEYSLYRENTNRFVRYQGDVTCLRDIKLLLPKKTTKEQAILLYKIYLNDIRKENG